MCKHSCYFPTWASPDERRPHSRPRALAPCLCPPPSRLCAPPLWGVNLMACFEQNPKDESSRRSSLNVSSSLDYFGLRQTILDHPLGVRRRLGRHLLERHRGRQRWREAPSAVAYRVIRQEGAGRGRLRVDDVVRLVGLLDRRVGELHVDGARQPLQRGHLRGCASQGG